MGKQWLETSFRASETLNMKPTHFTHQLMCCCKWFVASPAAFPKSTARFSDNRDFGETTVFPSLDSELLCRLWGPQHSTTGSTTGVYIYTVTEKGRLGKEAQEEKDRVAEKTVSFENIIPPCKRNTVFQVSTSTRNTSKRRDDRKCWFGRWSWYIVRMVAEP